jgi:hypothetical protein
MDKQLLLLLEAKWINNCFCYGQCEMKSFWVAKYVKCIGHGIREPQNGILGELEEASGNGAVGSSGQEPAGDLLVA